MRKAAAAAHLRCCLRDLIAWRRISRRGAGAQRTSRLQGTAHLGAPASRRPNDASQPARRRRSQDTFLGTQPTLHQLFAAKIQRVGAWFSPWRSWRLERSGRGSFSCWLASAGLAVAVLLSGCGYRLQNPPPLEEGLAISITSSDTRLVRSQAYLHSEVARNIRQRFGWDIHPQSGAQLELDILREDIASAARAQRGPTTRWSIEIRVHASLIRDGEVVLSSREQGRRPFRGTGYASSRDNEPEALRTAAENLAAQLSDWLEHNASRWSTQP